MCAKEGGELVADVGGTNVRFGLTTTAGGLSDRLDLECAGYPTFSAAAQAYLETLPAARRPRVGAIAVAGAISGDEVQMTNRRWAFSAEATRRLLGLDRLVVLNDFEALALAVPQLPADARESVKPGVAQPGTPVAVMGPGTGLGTSAVAFLEGSPIALPAEGGHRTLAATNEREWSVWRVLAKQFGHVSAECVLSGPGLSRLYSALREVDGSEPVEGLDAARIAEEARRGSCPHAVEALKLFSSWLGMVAGDLVLTLGARGGLLLGGGMLPKLGAAFDRAVFCERFAAKGRMSSYLEPIPIDMIVRRGVELLGAARALRRVRRGSDPQEPVDSPTGARRITR